MKSDPTLAHPLLARLPGGRGWLQRRYDHYFATCTDRQLFRGVFDSYADAQASAPPTKPLGYDNAASSELYVAQLRPHAHDYPALFWLARSFAEGMRSVFDLGGSVGHKYFAFSRLLPFPDDVRWTIEDVPAVIARGRRFAAERRAPPGVTFTADIDDGDGMDVLLASGVVQYLPETIGDMLARWRYVPRRIIVNTAAIHPTRSYFTLNSIGTAFCPYRVQAHGAFVREVTRAGYELRDSWENPAKYIRIPFELDADLDTYAGYCFDRE